MTSSGTRSARRRAKVPQATVEPPRPREDPGRTAGALLVANAVPDLALHLEGTPDEAIATAVASIREHDWRSSLPADPAAIRGRALPLALPAGAGAWEDGFADALLALARAIPLGEARPDPGAVAVVGLPVDRLEADRLADVAEVARLLGAIGLRVVASWPSGAASGALAEAASARFVVSLPYGRAAAAALAARTGAAVVDAGLPFGLGGTAAWLRAVGAATGREALAEQAAKRDLDRIVPRLEWVVPLWTLHRRVAFAGDRLLAGPFAAALRELGAEAVEWPCPGAAPDLVVGPRPVVEAAIASGRPHLEWGFPSPAAHALNPAPRLGFDGVPHVIEAMINRLSLCEVLAGIDLQRGR